jgi:hypothetical protein
MYEGIAKSSTVVHVRERESTNTVVIQDGFRPTIDWIKNIYIYTSELLKLYCSNCELYLANQLSSTDR